ncbi:trigger factor [Falsarthrobacter nasiphocae]|uniref:Trigger factor n=1 Tax=Falsarthrobacter nasiphocae TaxID=189863 RepID=A0AAE4C762_9MICC|nr:trigger factor [Falsarthrobacter nasiphocae]MDR6892912.1 trigger factor [Falsarthrobacter nasiphocae]
MKSAVETLTPTRVKLTVEVPFDEVKPSIEKAYKQVAEQVSIPGFRKGKIPASVVDQRVGRGYVYEQAINEGLNGWFQAALEEQNITPLSRPEVDITSAPDPETKSGDLVFELELDVKPSIELPDLAGLELVVEPVAVEDADVDTAIDELRGRFGTLKAADKPAAKDDFLTMDLTAKVDGEEVDSAADLSYQVGSGTMLEGLDEAVEGLSAGEDAIFTTKLAGGEHAGEDAEVKVVVKAVKTRELPEADDEFAQLASEFDTIAELRESTKTQVEQQKRFAQAGEARDKAIDALLEKVEVPVPDSYIDDQVDQHFTQDSSEGHDSDDHRAEVRQNTVDAFKREVVLDAVLEQHEVEVDQQELIDYIFQTSQQYGMDPQQFAQIIDQAGQLPMVIADVRRNKALSKVVELASVKDTDGNAVDLSSILGTAGDDDEAAEETAADEDATSESK